MGCALICASMQTINYNNTLCVINFNGSVSIISTFVIHMHITFFFYFIHCYNFFLYSILPEYYWILKKYKEMGMYYLKAPFPKKKIVAKRIKKYRTPSARKIMDSIILSRNRTYMCEKYIAEIKSNVRISDLLLRIANLKLYFFLHTLLTPYYFVIIILVLHSFVHI